MNRLFQLLLLMILVTLGFQGCNSPAEKVSQDLLRGPYAGSPVPGETPELFAPGFISTGLYERDVAISHDGKEIYFSVFPGDWATIMVTRQIKNQWMVPEVASFARDTSVKYVEPAFTPDGKHLLFLCTRPLDGSAPKPGWQDQNIWMVSKDEKGNWTEPEPLPPAINQSAQFFPSLSQKGTLYFSRTDGTPGVTSVYQADWTGDKDIKPRKLPEPVSGKGNIYNACISPDGSCLVACVAGRDSLIPPERPVYYAFFRENDRWTEGVNLDSILQLQGSNAISPSFSPDGKYFFFACDKKRKEAFYSGSRMNMTFLRERRNMPGNGNSDIYWVDADVIFKLKK
jgi:Tol biopolymer transport system component